MRCWIGLTGIVFGGKEGCVMGRVGGFGGGGCLVAICGGLSVLTE